MRRVLFGCCARYCVPKPSALLPQLGFACRLSLPFALTHARAGPRLRLPIVHSPGWKARKCPPSGSIRFLLAGIVARKKDEPMCGCLSGGTDHCGLGVLAGHDQRVLLGGAADHFVAGSKDTHVPACGVPGSPRLAIRTPSMTTKTPVPSDSMVHSACCFSVMGRPSLSAGHCVNAAARLRSRLADNAPGPCA